MFYVKQNQNLVAFSDAGKAETFAALFGGENITAETAHKLFGDIADFVTPIF